jgi:hypothetical protein
MRQLSFVHLDRVIPAGTAAKKDNQPGQADLGVAVATPWFGTACLRQHRTLIRRKVTTTEPGDMWHSKRRIDVLRRLPDMTHSLRWQRLVVIGGFLIVAIGWIGYTALTWHPGSRFDVGTRSSLLFGIASVVGYAILAAASWSWFRWIERSRVSLAGLTRVLRLFALGNLCLAVGVAAICYFESDQALNQPYDGRTMIVAAMSYGFEFFGFMLAAIAFWGASSVVGAVLPSPSVPEEGLVPA